MKFGCESDCAPGYPDGQIVGKRRMGKGFPAQVMIGRDCVHSLFGGMVQADE